MQLCPGPCYPWSAQRVWGACVSMCVWQVLVSLVELATTDEDRLSLLGQASELLAGAPQVGGWV